mmetsp:Transcript_115633/g.326900  ORF Transcript_115633/g.326900 Transcript_115633/m.326900 type:complete len:265 (-) Transcript_115633:51-845(-)
MGVSASGGTSLDSVAPRLNLDSVLDRVGSDQRKDFVDFLDGLSNRRVMFSHVAVWRQAFLGGAVDHHCLVYEYSKAGQLMSLKIDWGRDGLAFEDSGDDPCPNGDIIMRKKCRMKPNLVREQFLDVYQRNYDLVSWNCQHFSQHFFTLAEAAFQDMARVGLHNAARAYGTSGQPSKNSAPAEQPGNDYGKAINLMEGSSAEVVAVEQASDSTTAIIAIAGDAPVDSSPSPDVVQAVPGAHAERLFRPAGISHDRDASPDRNGAD